MQHHSPSAGEHRGHSPRHALFALLFLWPLAGWAQTQIDLLVIIDSDGLGYTAQQTLLAADDLVVSRLPSQRQTQTTAFAGASSALYRRAHSDDPDKISLASGSAFTRFRHRFADSANEPDQKTIINIAPGADGALPTDHSVSLIGRNNGSDNAKSVLRASLQGYNITMASYRSLSFNVTWVLPDNLELLKFHTEQPMPEDATAIWRRSHNLLSFEQSGSAPANPIVEYRVHDDEDQASDACLASPGPSDACSPDEDQDGVPDYRDLCLPSDTSDPSTTPSVTLPSISADITGNPLSATATSIEVDPDNLGCGDTRRIVLPRIQFESGQTYLNVGSRQVLDKVAIALRRLPDKLFRIGTHTDNAGYVHNNQKLSENRAIAIRHYLMLRGVGPNQLQARGYGETSPAHDNRIAAGRRANRRVELQLLN